MYPSIENSTTGIATILGQIVEKEKDTINENENQEMDDPDFDPMEEDLYAVLDEHEFKFNRSTKVSQKEADLLMQVILMKLIEICNSRAKPEIYCYDRVD